MARSISKAIARVTCTLRRREPFDRAREARAIVPRLIDLRVPDVHVVAFTCRAVRHLR
jgi:hypothetical protein